MAEEKNNISKADFRFMNDALVDVYDHIMRIEEETLRKSTFRDISVKEIHLIHAITLHDHKTSTEVANELRLTKGTLTTSVKTLERKGYVKRINDEQDHRVTRLTLTNKGKLLYRAHDAFHRQIVKSFIKGMDGNEVKVIKRALINLEDFLSDITQ
jgi:DNA-binding MarR family transcriptional regulator